MLETTGGRWLIGAVAAFGIVALLAWARNDPGVDGRDPEPPPATTTTVVVDSLPVTTDVD